MNQGKTIFAQLMSLFTEYEFSKCVKRYKGDRHAIKFTCRDQFMAMSFAQFTDRSGLRDIETTLGLCSQDLYRSGLKIIPRSTLAEANEKKDWRIYQGFGNVLIHKAKELYKGDTLRLNLEEMVCAFDSSTIELCLSLCPWATLHHGKGGVKMHTMIDLNGSIPTFVRLTEASVHDSKIMEEIPVEPNAYYLMDKGYVKFDALYKHFHQKHAWFVTRAKDNMKYAVVESREVDPQAGLITDETIKPPASILTTLDLLSMKTLETERSIASLPTTSPLMPLLSRNFIGRGGRLSCSSNGLSNTCTSRTSMERPVTPSTRRYG